MTQFGNNLPNFLIGSGVDTLIGLGDADSLVSSTAGVTQFLVTKALTR